MKKTLPLVLGMLFGFYAVAEFYIPHHAVGTLTDEFRSWAGILTAAAFVLGGVNILQVTWPKIRRREADWEYKVILLAAAGVMLLVGLPWHRLVGSDAKATVTVAAGASAAGPATVIVEAPADVVVQVGSAVGAGKDAGGKPFTTQVEPGEVSIKLSRRVAGYQPQEVKATLTAGQVATVRGDPPMLWGKEGRLFVWLYDHVFAPCNSTMFALLAFFVASAAFRAFRARNVEAGLLLGAAMIMLLGRIPMGRALWDDLPDIAQWLLDVPNNGGRRAIMMGAAVGAIATGLRVILGLERSHLGSD